MHFRLRAKYRLQFEKINTITTPSRLRVVSAAADSLGTGEWRSDINSRTRIRFDAHGGDGNRRAWRSAEVWEPDFGALLKACEYSVSPYKQLTHGDIDVADALGRRESSGSKVGGLGGRNDFTAVGQL